MDVFNLNKFLNGWFVGNFEPSLIKTNDVEVAVKSYTIGDHEDRHYHKLATEITVIIAGSVLMNGIEYKTGDVIIIEPKESTDFEALDNTICVVVKHPGISNDKYDGEYND